LERRVAAALNSARRRRFDRAVNEELFTGYPEISRIASEPEPPDHLLIVDLVAGGVTVRERHLKYLRTYSFEMARAVTFRTYAHKVIARESGRSQVTNGKTSATSATSTRSFVPFTVPASLQQREVTPRR